jgi:hypothetical protein
MMPRTYWHSFSTCGRSSSSYRIFTADHHFRSGADKIEVASNGWDLVHCSTMLSHTSGIVIAVHGAHRNTGSVLAPADTAIGFFVAPRSGHNVGHVVPAAATAEAATLQAAITVLRLATDIAPHTPYFGNDPLR